MALFNVETWIKSPPDRDVISRWTVGRGESRSHRLELALPHAPENFSFLVVGDTGDSENAAGAVSPQYAVAAEMAAEFLGPARPAMVLHLGDVVYMTGEKRLYDRNFRRPYGPFLTPESTATNLVFRTPFLPVPGNHDYYDVRGWVLWLARLPLLGPGLRTLIQQIFAFGMPEGGSDMGRTFMEAFVDLEADTSQVPLKYIPGTLTRLPNRYYCFRYGSVDFFALDSNTLDAPPPWRSSQDRVREEAASSVTKLEETYHTLDAELRRRERKLTEWRRTERERIAEDPLRRETILSIAVRMAAALHSLAGAMRVQGQASGPCAPPAEEAEILSRRWQHAEEDLRHAAMGETALRIIEAMEEVSDDACSLLREVEGCLGAVGEGEYKSKVLDARNEVDSTLGAWSSVVSALPPDLCDEIRDLSERALDVQRELALERRRMRFRPEDYDSAQIEWLQAGLDRSIQENPAGWRIVYLHHPLYSSIHNHCERSDIQDVRGNLQDVLKGRAHLVIGGHAHAFEWFRSGALPGAGIFVSGGGGQVSLRRSIFDPRLFGRSRSLFEAMREAGAQEWCGAGRGPDARDGATGNLYHYLKVEVSPDRLFVRPVGVRRLSRDEYRREEPVPVYNVPEMGGSRPKRTVRLLAGVEITKDGRVSPVWSP